VKKCVQRDTNKLFAVKIMRNYDHEKEMASRNEFELMKAIPDHPNIIKAEEFIATERWTYTVMEYASGVELQNLKNAAEHAKPVMKQLLSAIGHLHKNLICHKDIKPENIIVKKDLTGKV
jgi:serine/threonine protein kinase